MLNLLNPENLNFLYGIYDGVANIVLGASLIAAVTKTPKDDDILKPIKKAINFFALNFKIRG